MLTSRKDTTVAVFTHGQLMQLMRILIAPDAKTKSAKHIMQEFRQSELSHPVKNGEIFRLVINDDGSWSDLETVFVPEI